jgi:CheY-like chemotaxis protein
MSFMAETLRGAVELAGELRRILPGEVAVRPVRVSRSKPSSWAVLALTPSLGVTGLAALDEEMRRIAATPGRQFLGAADPSRSGPVAPSQPPANDTHALMRVVVIDDSAVFRRAVRRLIESRGYRVVGEADRATAGFRAVEALKPDAVMLDVVLPDGSGVDLCAVLTRQANAPAVILVSASDRIDARIAQESGAQGFVPKSDLVDVAFELLWRRT